jgi:hypothetical protein
MIEEDHSSHDPGGEDAQPAAKQEDASCCLAQCSQLMPADGAATKHATVAAAAVDSGSSADALIVIMPDSSSASLQHDSNKLNQPEEHDCGQEVLRKVCQLVHT